MSSLLQPSYRARALTAILALAAYATADPPAAAGDGPKARAGADALYHNYCSVCHGDRGDGRSRARNSLVPPPRDFTTPEARAQLSRERMIAAVADGRPGTAMVGWKTQLGEREIAAVVDYIRDTFMAPRGAANLGRGKALYASNCAVCHGDHGQGAVWAGANMQRPPRDFTSPQAATELTRERMITAVTHGRPGTAMAGFGAQLSGPDIEAVVDFVRTAFMMPGTGAISGTRAHAGREPGAATAATGADMRAPFPKGLKGNRAQGRQFYLANCATCHGAKGDGQGPRAYFQNPKPRDFLDPAWKRVYNRPFLFAAVSTGKLGTEMPAWSKVLNEQQIADVAEFVFREFIQPQERAAANR